MRRSATTCHLQMCQYMILSLLAGYWWKQQLKYCFLQALLWSTHTPGSVLLTAFMSTADILSPVICTALSTCCKPLEASFIVKFCSWLLHFMKERKQWKSRPSQPHVFWGRGSSQWHETCLMVFEDLLYSCCRRMCGWQISQSISSNLP